MLLLHHPSERVWGAPATTASVAATNSSAMAWLVAASWSFLLPKLPSASTACQRSTRLSSCAMADQHAIDDQSAPQPSSAPAKRRHMGAMPAVTVEVVRNNNAGAFVVSEKRTEGNVYEQELALFGANVWPGDLLVGYAAKPGPGGKLDVCWHPFGHQTTIEACQRVLMALLASPKGTLAVGWRSQPDDVMAAVNLTRSQFKIAAQRLELEGAILPLSKEEMQLAPNRPWPKALPRPPEAEDAGQPADDGAETHEVFVQGLPFALSPREVLDIFQLHGKIRSLRGVLAGPGSGSGHAWVRYESAEAVEAALATNGTVIDRRFLAVLRGSSRASRQTLRMRLSPSVAVGARSGPRGPGPGRGGAPRTRVLVSSLPERTDEFELLDAFLDCGDVRRVLWPRQPRAGHCIIEFFDEASADKAVRDAQRRRIGGVPLSVKFDEPREGRGNGRGGRGGGGGGGRGGAPQRRGRGVGRPQYQAY